MASIKDVAKLSGVSITTVSRVMNNRGYIGKSTRTKVEKAMKALNYQPNQIARALQKSQSKLIGIIVPNIAHPFFSELIYHVELAAGQQGYRLMVCNSLQDAEKETNYINMLRQHQADGIIVCSHTLTTQAYQYEDIPVLSFDRIISSSIPYVASDNFHGGELATEHLIERGCKYLLHIAGPSNHELLANRRKDAFELTGLKKEVETYWIEGASVGSTFQDNYQFIESHVGEALRKYDGVFCSNDIMAYALYMYASHHGIEVPKQLKIIGFDNHYFTRMLQNPKITTIQQSINYLGESLVFFMLNHINRRDFEEQAQNLILDVSLVQGDTT